MASCPGDRQTWGDITPGCSASGGTLSHVVVSSVQDLVALVHLKLLGMGWMAINSRAFALLAAVGGQAERLGVGLVSSGSDSNRVGRHRDRNHHGEQGHGRA